MSDWNRHVVANGWSPSIRHASHIWVDKCCLERLPPGPNPESDAFAFRIPTEKKVGIWRIWNSVLWLFLLIPTFFPQIFSTEFRPFSSEFWLLTQNSNHFSFQFWHFCLRIPHFSQYSDLSRLWTQISDVVSTIATPLSLTREFYRGVYSELIDQRKRHFLDTAWEILFPCSAMHDGT